MFWSLTKYLLISCSSCKGFWRAAVGRRDQGFGMRNVALIIALPLAA